MLMGSGHAACTFAHLRTTHRLATNEFCLRAWQVQLCLHSKCASWLCVLLLLGCVCCSCLAGPAMSPLQVRKLAVFAALIGLCAALAWQGRLCLHSMCTSRQAPRHAHTCTHMHAHTYTHTHTHARTHIHMHAHTHANTYTHIAGWGPGSTLSRIGPACSSCFPPCMPSEHLPTVCQAYCVPSLLCAKPTVCQAHCVPSLLCAKPTLCHAHGCR